MSIVLVNLNYVHAQRSIINYTNGSVFVTLSLDLSALLNDSDTQCSQI